MAACGITLVSVSTVRGTSTESIIPWISQFTVVDVCHADSWERVGANVVGGGIGTSSAVDWCGVVTSAIIKEHTGGALTGALIACTIIGVWFISIASITLACIASCITQNGIP